MEEHDDLEKDSNKKIDTCISQAESAATAAAEAFECVLKNKMTFLAK